MPLLPACRAETVLRQRLAGRILVLPPTQHQDDQADPPLKLSLIFMTLNKELDDPVPGMTLQGGRGEAPGSSDELGEP